jgi:hypothetical protein
MKVTRFKILRSTTPEKVTSLSEVLDDIRSDKYKSKIEAIRQDENPSKCAKKNYLPVFTPTGTFSHRSIKGLEKYNGIICLDLDHVEDVVELKRKASKLKYVLAAFITPSGSGLKVIIKSDATIETYKEAEILISTAFQNDAGGIRDNHCKDIARIQFVSYDPDLYYNQNSKTFITNL